MASSIDTSKRPLPESIEAEKALISVLLSKEGADFVSVAMESGFRADFFKTPEYGGLFQVILKLHGRKELDWVNIVNEANEAGLTERLGGLDALASLNGFYPHSGDFKSHLSLVTNAFVRRKIISRSIELIDEAMNDQRGSELAERASREFLELSNLHGASSSLVSQQEALDNALDEIIARSEEGAESVIPTPWRKMNQALGGGIGVGEITFVAARPSMGKTAFGLNMLQGAARQDIPGLFVSLESSVSRLVARVISSFTGLPVSSLSRGKISRDELSEAHQCLSEAKELPIVWSKLHGGSHYDISRVIRKAVRESGVKLVVVDYLQKLGAAESSERSDMRIRMDNALDALCPLADELGVALVIVAQLNRNAEGIEGRKLDLAMLKETSRMEQDADVILMIGKGGGEISGECKPVTIAIPKVRDGATALVDLKLHGPTTTFMD